MKDPKITTYEVSKLIRMSPQFVRVAMQQEKINIGTAIKIGPKKWSYNIVPKLLAERQGITVEELLKDLEEIRCKEQSQ